MRGLGERSAGASVHEARPRVDQSVLAIDVGGAAIKSGIVDPNGLVSTRLDPAPAGADPAEVFAHVARITRSLVARARIEGVRPSGIGIVVPGLVDSANGVALESRQFGWRGVPVAPLLEERFDLPVALGHDVRAGAMAESGYGAGRGSDRVLFVAIGANIACAVVENGRIIREGELAVTREIGHLRVSPRGSTVQEVASTVSVAQRYQRASGLDSELDVRGVTRAVEQGDLAAQEVWEDTVEALAYFLAAAILIIRPAKLVIGGGLADAGDTLLRPLRRALSARIEMTLMTPMCVAALGRYAGCLGAGLLALGLVE